MPPRFHLRFKNTAIPALASRYAYAGQDKVAAVLASIPRVKKLGHLTKKDLEKLAHWKSTRSAGRVQGNSDSYVREVTKFAFATRDERGRIESLTILDGVGWPTASCILHFFHREAYPILDVRALESLSVEVPKPVTFEFWWAYVEYCRKLARKTGTDMRTLDRALWQWSKENG